MKAARFHIRDAAGAACKSGFGEAEALFKKNRTYSFAQMSAAGLSPDNILWMVRHRAPDDAAVLAGVRRWAAECGQPVASDASLGDAMHGVKRGYAAVWKQALREGATKRQAADQAGAFRFEALKRAFA